MDKGELVCKVGSGKKWLFDGGECGLVRVDEGGGMVGMEGIEVEESYGEERGGEDENEDSGV